MAYSDSSCPVRSLRQRRPVSLLIIYGSALLLLVSVIPTTEGRSFASIFSFGDSIADTGNLYFSSQPPPSHKCFRHPYGKTFFGHPVGRCSDGRLIIDFIAESLEIPRVKPYLGIKNGQVKNWNKEEEGVNFAVAGATALDQSFFQERGITVPTNDSLTVQLGWFKELLPSLCNSSSSCKKVLGKSLFLVGEIGGNDFNHPFALQMKLSEVETYVGPVISVISSTIKELIHLGAQTLIVPGNFPIGCSASYLTRFQSNHKNDYDKAGCLVWLNKFVEFYNKRLQSEVNRLQQLYPHAHIIYADYYNAALPLYHSPTKFGFTSLKACCGIGGAYNFKTSRICGDEGVKACEDPSKYINWDGVHLTEAAYRFIAKALVNGRLTTPKFDALHFNNHITTGSSYMDQSA
ncbi:GDSL esterase/lipase At1g28610-like [Neltuma alba]|uniref:GDSL esterase/lipase At1g28610-like n=1 Tax=Neltuma alba TaxID=207710 RepID=UPI0010A2F15C|nr:GDSL esterase/lipase At1g28610-like [Prosopis alba]